MVVCDADLRIVAIDPRMPGSFHDSFVCGHSALRHHLTCGLLNDEEFLLVLTCGVYEGQERNQRELMTLAYWELLVQGDQSEDRLPITKVPRATPSFLLDEDAHVAPDI
ncbi:hypothetical protein HPB49_005412 [Dermacentor silvarum]|uniref:Uncharacterized protein n=1 Tax=Dermacentor silvarum TaxID=543639 RepID=A0ACB8DUT9_DERSI|nr:hypothetical protein HPB49_005412 [Dermacentor silvarum]